MKYFYLLPIAFLTLSCSVKNQPYYFGYYKSQPAAPVAKADAAAVDNQENGITAPPAAPVFEASAATVPSVSAPASSRHSNVSAPAVAEQSTNVETKSEKKVVANSGKGMNKIKAAKKAANSFDGWAIAGFVCSLVGILFAWPLCIVGIVFSALGMKSGRRGLAIAGLVIGIVGTVLGLTAGALLLT